MKAILLAVLLGASATAAADACKMTGDIAEKMMMARQLGVSMQSVMAAAESPLRKAMVMDAYEVPRYATDEFQKRKAQDFRDKWYMSCYKSSQDS